MWADFREHVILEDEAILVLNKPPGISVMGERHESDLVRLAADAGEELFPAHRIDKVTSGVILFAKNLPAHGALTRQFNKRTVEKSYLAVVSPGGLPETGHIDLPLSVGRKNRVRIAAPRETITETGGRWSVPASAVFDTVSTYPSQTSFTVRTQTPDRALLEAHPHTGRRHQIRVHLAWIGHPIVGDPLFEKHPEGRTYLHSWRLTFDHAGTRVTVEAPMPADFAL
ncbi:RluA family pseudouridine synthase [Dactylosporangium matsuzakiense]|uniref:RNA pseudouridylate synthase n=1 Tax=Dactylosporangium matsuzakiense TaxID=53360 RepID=A0A9W6NK64_9ACTN|nr:RluA family pseudouridine synthase [Dactylosporangium matsuzakiense]UWZ44423.1 RluA family pseudouridine synthase [Dactylosporangium matsuzakiense]GLK99411.1 RNA pseudouridine synthase [Dactylosporangium matsuzakiense]